MLCLRRGGGIPGSVTGAGGFVALHRTADAELILTLKAEAAALQSSFIPIAHIFPDVQVAMPNFRIPPKPKPPPIGELTVWERRDLYDRAPSTSTYVPRIMTEQAKIEAQLLELEGMRDIQVDLEILFREGKAFLSVSVPDEWCRGTRRRSTSSMSLEASGSTIKKVPDTEAPDEEDTGETAKQCPAHQASYISSPALAQEHADT
ncbi:hypothetical protein EDB87DRAFT_1682170 [Lactarius vividus]|nr:hypothetical protein EDB87DRAFT_1682170 [Lactarius vividus]